MNTPWNHCDDLFSTQLNHATRHQLSDRGVNRNAVSRVVRRGELIPVTDRVLRLRRAAPVKGESAMAAVLDHGGDSRASHSTAAAWWGVAGFTLRQSEVVRSSRSRVRSSLATPHQVRALPAEWCTVLNGLPVVRPELCILQLCGSEPLGRAARALDNAWASRLLSSRSLTALVAQYGEMGRNGTAVLRRLLDERGPGYVPPATNIESRMRWVLEQGGLGGFRLQVDSGGERWTGRVDFRHQFLPLIIEVQSARHHTALLDRAHDECRRAQLERDGFHVVEVTDAELWSSGIDVVQRVLEATTLVRNALAS